MLDAKRRGFVFLLGFFFHLQLSVVGACCYCCHWRSAGNGWAPHPREAEQVVLTVPDASCALPNVVPATACCNATASMLHLRRGIEPAEHGIPQLCAVILGEFLVRLRVFVWYLVYNTSNLEDLSHKINEHL